MVDHEQRRRELAGAVWRVIAREGVAEVSIRSVATESGWSSGALRHYFAQRHTESSIAFAFLALGLRDPELARVQRLHFTGMYELCLRRVGQLVPAPVRTPPVTLARRLHALVDGLTVHVLAGHLTPAEMVQQLDEYLDELADPSAARCHRRDA